MALTLTLDAGGTVFTFDGTISPVREGPLQVRAQELTFPGVRGMSRLGLGYGERELVVDQFFMQHSSYNTPALVLDAKHKIETYIDRQGTLSDGIHTAWKKVVLVLVDGKGNVPIPRSGSIANNSAYWMDVLLLFKQLKPN